MTKKAEQGQGLNQTNGNQQPITKTASPPTQATNLPQVVVHHNKETEEGKQALLLINHYFVHRKASTLDYLAQFIIESGQTFKNFNAFMYANEGDNLFFRKSVEQMYNDGLHWKHKEAGFIRIWCIDGLQNYVAAASFNMVGKFRRKKHTSPDLVPYDVKVEAIERLKKTLLLSE